MLFREKLGHYMYVWKHAPAHMQIEAVKGREKGDEMDEENSMGKRNN